jgi:HK97 family phage portal protein
MDDRYWNHGGVETAAGVRVNPESALRSNAVYSCINVRKETLAACSIGVWKRLSGGDKELAPKHPAYRVLHDRPNPWQTAFEWVEMMQAHLDLRGNAYSRIVPGPTGPLDQLVPMHPDRVTANLYTDGSIDYTVRKLDGTTETLQFWQVLHLRGWSQDGVHGLTPISAQRDTIGISLAGQDYNARFLKNDVSPSIILKHPGVLGPEAYSRLKGETITENTAENRHAPMILEENMSVEKLGMSNRDAQIIENEKMTDGRICAMYRVPPHMIGLMDAATHSNAEQLGLEFRTLTMVPIAKRWEGIFARDLFFPLFDDPDGEYFAEFELDSLVRGDLLTSYTAFSIGRNWGWLSANDVRRLLKMNNIGTQGDEYLRPLNMSIEGAPQPTKQLGQGATDGDEGNDKPGKTPEDDEAGEQAAAIHSRLFALAEESAGRMARKESLAVKKLVSRYRAQKTVESNLAFCAAVTEFYSAHAKVIASSLRISSVAASQFCLVNAESVRNAGRIGNWPLVDATILMNEGRVRDLAQLAMVTASAVNRDPGGNVQ